MIRLTLQSQAGDSVRLEVSDVRVTGGVLWNQLDHGLLAHFSDNHWVHRGQLYTRISLAGGCCLLFGIARDPALISDPLELFSFTGPIFHAAGIAVALYNEQQDMWEGCRRPLWWSSMRIVSAATVAALVDLSQVEILNPWEADEALRDRSARHRLQAPIRDHRSRRH